MSKDDIKNWKVNAVWRLENPKLAEEQDKKNGWFKVGHKWYWKRKKEIDSETSKSNIIFDNDVIKTPDGKIFTSKKKADAHARALGYKVNAEYSSHQEIEKEAKQRNEEIIEKKSQAVMEAAMPEVFGMLNTYEGEKFIEEIRKNPGLPLDRPIPVTKDIWTYKAKR